MGTIIRILHIDDSIHDRQLVKDALQKEHDDFDIIEADSREKFEQHLSENDFDLVLSDFNILGFDGLQVLQVVKEKNPGMPVIIVTGTGSEEIAIQAMKMGASDYVIKSVSHIRGLAHTIRFVLENKKVHDEQEKIRESLRISEEKYRSIFENTNVAILLTSPDGRIFSANYAACTLFGRTETEICQLGRDGIVDLNDNRLNTLLEEREKKGQVKGELNLIKKDSTIFPAEISSAIFFDKEGHPVTSMVIHDLTLQKLAEEKLQKATIELQTILKNMLNAFVIWESEFDSNGNYVSFRFGYFNDAYERISGVKQIEVLGKNVFEIWPDTEQSWVDVYGKVALTGVPATFDMYHKPTKGWYHCNAYRPDESPNKICVIFEDISERKISDNKIKDQLEELQHWYNATIEREERILEIKREVNELLVLLGKPIRYTSVDPGKL